MTANALAEDVVMVKTVGMNEHIATLLDMNKLGDIVKNWL